MRSGAAASSPLIPAPIVVFSSSRKKKHTTTAPATPPISPTPSLLLHPPKNPHQSHHRRRRQLLLLLLSSSSAPLLLPRESASADTGEPTSNYELFDPVTESEKAASLAVSRRVDEALRLLDLARRFQSQGDFTRALDSFTLVVKDYKDFAFTEYARVGRALALYELGDRDEAIAEMEDVSISMKGYPEVHAALAAALYVDKHAPLLAENQFTIATILDPHYTDISYVRDTKHWPPSLVSSLKLFITLS